MPDCKFKMMRCQGGRLAVRRAFKILGWSARCELAANGFQPGSFNPLPSAGMQSSAGDPAGKKQPMTKSRPVRSERFLLGALWRRKTFQGLMTKQNLHQTKAQRTQRDLAPLKRGFRAADPSRI